MIDQNIQNLIEEATEESKLTIAGIHPIFLNELKVDYNDNTKWILEGYIAKGCITLFSAMYKSGKSTLIRCFLKALQNEEEFLGQPTKKINILYISEENASIWVEKRDKFELLDTNIHLISKPFNVKPTYKEWESFIIDINAYCIANKIELVIIDTLATILAS